MSVGTLAVEVVWSPAPREMQSIALRLPEGATVAAALAATGWPAFAAAQQGEDALLAEGLSVAIWSRPRPLTHALCDGDRVEVLRKLTVAPMEARRARYQAAGGVQALRKRGSASRK